MCLLKKKYTFNINIFMQISLFIDYDLHAVFLSSRQTATTFIEIPTEFSGDGEWRILFTDHTTPFCAKTTAYKTFFYHFLEDLSCRVIEEYIVEVRR